ncbi:SGNH/GDSL hydrolase family protein [Psychrobacillus sp.]|uniref:SGNH/GDSL hydrolase family protein n=1 Tax=Psychrobacillus sp. TaxID=1871623 RepID=UPI0028BD2834|nr:SGNH/GDSL hydrolase family protein [Psychrobacillus sp.]
MAYRDIGNLWDRLTRIAIKQNFEELFSLFTSLEYKESEARSIALQALSLAKKNELSINSLQEQINNLIVNSGESNAETVNSRTTKDGYTFATLKERLDDADARINRALSANKLSLIADIQQTDYKKGDLVDVEELRQKVMIAYYTFMKNLRELKPVWIMCIGDSLTYGSDATSTDRRPASGVVFPDGSTSGITRASITYPEALQKYLNEVFYKDGTNLVTVENRGFPGDWAPKGYDRSFTKHVGQLTFIGYGTNDARRAIYPDAGNVEVFINSLEQIVIREILWGKAVILLTPPKTLISDIAVDSFANAVIGLANKYGIPYLDVDEMVAGYDSSIYSDDTHFTGAGYGVIGAKIAAALVGEGPHKRFNVMSGSKLLGRQTLDSVQLSKNATSTTTTSASAPTPPEFSSSPQMVLLSNQGGRIVFGFYATIPDMVVVPYLFYGNGVTYKITLDFALPQAQNILDTSIGDATQKQDEVANQHIDVATSTKHINKKYLLDNNIEPIRITQKGYHTISIENEGASLGFYGIEFMSYNEWYLLKKLKSLEV